MPRTVIAQISDPHIPGESDPLFQGSTPRENLRAALIHASQRAAAIVITGDLAARAGTDAEYAGLASLLDEVGVPVLLCAGNHDESEKIRNLFGVVGHNDRCDYLADVPGGRIIVLDSSRRGREDGALDSAQLAWLDRHLADGIPTVVAMHHPCFPVGGRSLDTVRLDDDSIAGLAEVIGAHQVLAVVSGHAHMTLSAPFAGTTAYVCPSVAYEFWFRDRSLIYRPGHPQYMEYSWSSNGSGFMARVVTVARESEWLVMESF